MPQPAHSPSLISELHELLGGHDSLRSELPGSSDVRVAILDGPVELSHPALAQCSISIASTPRGNDLSQRRAAAHGTAVASVVFAFAPATSGWIIPVFFDVDGDKIACSQLDLARGIVQAVELGAHWINISGGQLSQDGSAHPLLLDAIRFAASRDVVVAAAVGNDGCDCLHVPAALPFVLAVGAMDRRGQPLLSSNWGEQFRTNGLLVPGEDIPAAAMGGDFTHRTGTSYACAVASGIAALLMSADARRGRRIVASRIRSVLLQTAKPCQAATADCAPFLAGRVDVTAALNALTQEGAQMTSAEGEHANQLGTETGPGMDTISAAPPTIVASDCGCGSAQAPKDPGAKSAANQSQVQVVYALGSIGVDFGSEARRDSLAQHIAPIGPGSPKAADATQLLKYLDEHPYDAQSIHWTLTLDGTPIYVIRPGGPFAGVTYERLREFFRDQLAGKIERVSIPGIVVGQNRLMSGQVLPALWPELRDMYSWNTGALVEASTKDRADDEEARRGLREFLERVYNGLRNLGLSARDRAINYAATNALNAAHVFEAAIKDRMTLDEIEAERSPLCRPESECWDVKMIFFDPERQTQRARKVYRFTVDVSDSCPVMIGEVRSWSIR